MITTIAVILAVLLSACGGGSAPASAPTSAPAATEAPGSTEAPAATEAPGATQAPAVTAPAATEAPIATEPAAPVAPAKLNLNTVTEDELLGTIPSFGNRMVREFFEYRPYTSILQFRQEIGKYVSAEQVAAYEQYVYVPIDVNSSDAATLQQLPGVDASVAESLVAGRPYASNDAFLSALAAQVSAEQLAAAPAYLAAQ